MNLDDMDGMSEEELMKFFEKMFMSEIPGTGVTGINMNKVGNSGKIEAFEELMKMLILPHLIMGGEKGAIKGVKVIKLGENKNPPPTDPDADTSWLDDYLK